MQLRNIGLSFLILLAGLVARAQSSQHSFEPIDTVLSDPTGTACSGSGLERYNSSLFVCQSGTWANVGTGAGAAPSWSTGTGHGGALSASMNTVINVMAAPYNALGDCVHDDSAAFTAAQTAAIALAGGNTTAATLYFPKPPGGCYLTSTFHWLGVSLEGEVSGIPNTAGGVVIQSKPGQDILEVQDPTLVSFSLRQDWAIQNISFVLDDSANGSFPHRWPGRWFDDGAITSGSAVFHSANAMISCGDVGQAIQVNGAGSLGANLVTTISSVSPCWTGSGDPGSSMQVVTLATTASTTVSNAHSYISVANLPVTANIGSAAIAFDDKDGLKTNWVNSNNVAGGLRNLLRNVSFSAIGGGLHNNVGIFTQGQQILYGLRADHFSMQGLTYGIVASCAELNSFQASCSGDYQSWEHASFSSVVYPIIETNGLENRYINLQLGPANYGPQFVQLANLNQDTFRQARIEQMGFENGAYTGTIGWRIEGAGHSLDGVALAGGNGQIAYFDTRSSTCLHCLWNNLALNGANNYISAADGDQSATTVTDRGVGNRIEESYLANPLNSLDSSRVWSPVPTMGKEILNGRFKEDFIQDGNSTPYVRDDLFIWPKDIIFNSGGNPYSTFYQDDATSPTGGYTIWTSSWAADTFSQTTYGATATANNHFYVGTNVPAGWLQVFWLAKCASAGTQSIMLSYITPGSVRTDQQAFFSCTTSWSQFSARINLNGLSGDFLQFRNPSNTASINIAWMYLRPDLADINGVPVSGYALGLSGTTGSIGGSALTAGTCSSGTATVTGATTSMAVIATPGTYPGDAFDWKAYVSAANTVTVKICTNLAAGGTPTASTYNVRVIQ